ncbi:MAG: BolA family transcriptional regulator [Xanthomonadaceae bacterium]|jgi:BolA protein|nr:BolA family transcriptional regulator [Xanthomonadaceae bacterium]
MNRIERIRAVLEETFVPDSLSIEDNSCKHHGHEGARNSGGHYHVDIVSARFDGVSLLARHRAVYAALTPMMGTDIHALSIAAFPPGECGK